MMSSSRNVSELMTVQAEPESTSMDRTCLLIPTSAKVAGVTELTAKSD